MEREKFSSRLGFILISAGCAIGLGNVWRFPYITGQYGGAAFVLVFLAFLVLLGIPIMAMEFSVGRGSQKSAIRSFHVLQPKGNKWGWFGYAAMIGNYMLMMFYTTVAGWIVYYFFSTLTGRLAGKTTDEVGAYFGGVTGNPLLQIGFMTFVTILCFYICSSGLKKGVEKITKTMMLLLLMLVVVLAVWCCTLPGAGAGIQFYLVPDFSKLTGEGIFAAMGQAFFTLSIGIGSMAIFGSYIGKERRLLGETVNITILDTFIGLMSGLIIFSAGFAFGVDANSGPGLLFVTLPNVFNTISGGNILGALFFLFMSFAALSTVIAVFENLISFLMDLKGWSRRKATWINCALMLVLALPCILGFNVWSDVHPIKEDWNILALEDFILSNNLLPLGSLVYLFFCTWKSGWGWNNFLAEVNTGKGLRFPTQLRWYVTFVLPLVVVLVFILGYYNNFIK